MAFIYLKSLLQLTAVLFFLHCVSCAASEHILLSEVAMKTLKHKPSSQ